MRHDSEAPFVGMIHRRRKILNIGGCGVGARFRILGEGEGGARGGVKFSLAVN